MPSPTAQQQRAIEATGDVLVMAGAGAGKTSTLVARILRHLTEATPRLSLDRLLVVTFNEAAAGEMRHRLGLALEARQREHPEDTWVAEQLALLESARVSTLHAFCLQLVREHFHELGLDPRFGVMDEIQAQILGDEALSGVLRGHFAGDAPGAEQVRPFLERHAREGDRALRALIWRVHEYMRSLPEPAEWLRLQREGYARATPDVWQTLLGPGLRTWARGWLESVERLAARDPQNFAATEVQAALVGRVNAAVAEDPHPFLAALRHAGDKSRYKKGTIGTWYDPLKDLFAEVERWSGCFETEALAEDWTWARPDVLALLELVEQFDRAFEAARRQGSLLDFADLEQLALRVLWDPARQCPTPRAEQWRRQFDLVFVDEYQDINGAQDRILSCVSRDAGGPAANRFFVGDVKQSIYRFRRADPRIFQRYAAAWRGGVGGTVIPLAENFRSHEAILGFVNVVFSTLMRPEVGGVAYDAEARLTYGAPDARPALRAQPQGRVEAHWLLTDSRVEEDVDEGEGVASEPADSAGGGGVPTEDLDAEQAQARVVARRLRRWHDEGLLVWDARLGGGRTVQWRDMVVLHPAPRPVAERWAREFQRAGIPFEARRSGFFAALEVSDLVCLLRLLDNPLQDLPLIAVLRSPLVGMTLDELAVVRWFAREGAYWAALECLGRDENAGTSDADAEPAVRAAANLAREKYRWFRPRFERWRRLAREGSLALCLETVLAETGYEAWLRAQPRAEALLANVRRLVDASRQFDQYQRHGLYRFLAFLDAQADSGREVAVASVASSNSVRLLSMHQSKGLEFPVVVVAGLGRSFNLRDLHGPWLLDAEWGVCPPVIPPNERSGYPSVVRWLAGARQRLEALGEQLRLLYVALTRPMERLVLVGATRAARLETWTGEVPPPTARDLARGRDPLAWLGPLMPQLTGRSDWAEIEQGQGTWLDWYLHRPEEYAATSADFPSAAVAASAEPVSGAANASVLDPALLEALRSRLSWAYPWPTATREPAKLAVTALRRRWEWAHDEEAATAPAIRPGRGAGVEPWTEAQGAVSLAAVTRGSVHHLFCELVTWEATENEERFRAEVPRMVAEGWLEEREARELDLEGLWAFWNSPVAAAIRVHEDAVHRELPFTARLRSSDLRALGHPHPAGLADEDFQVIQGVVDLAVVLPEEIWIVDYKTDRVGRDGGGVDARVQHHALQLQVYAFALSQIFRRPVTRRWLYFIEARRCVEVP